MNRDDQYAVFDAGMKKLAAQRPFVKLDLDWATAISILSNLQLALRHPGNTAATARRVRNFCDNFLAEVERVAPDLAAVLRMGDDPRHDQPRTAAPALLANLEFAVWCLENPGMGPTPDALANMKTAIARAKGEQT